MKYKEFLEKMNELVPGFSNRFEEVEVNTIEVCNAPATADFFGIRVEGFCKTVNNPCDYGVEELIADAIIEALTDWRTGYFKYGCEKGGWEDEPEKTICEIIDNIYDIIRDSPYDEEEFYVRLLAGLDEELDVNKTIVVIFYEDNIDWDVFAFVDKKDEALLDEIEKYMDWLEQKMDEAMEKGDEETYNYYSDCKCGNFKECYNEFKKSK